MTITKALHDLEQALSQTAPEIVNRFQVGLTRAEIDRHVASFSWTMPPEVYALYQWHNGLSGQPGKLNLAEKFLRLKGKWHGELAGRENELHLELSNDKLSLEHNLITAKFLPLDYALAGHRHLKLGRCPIALLPIFVLNQGKNTFYGMIRLDEKDTFYFANGTGIAPLRITEDYLSRQIQYSSLMHLVSALSKCCPQMIQPINQNERTEKSADYQLNVIVLNQLHQ